MSEGDVSLIQDEDVLRRMWQQTEDFSRKKEIRAHMYRLREERLRNLYSPEPALQGKGCEFTSTQGHGRSFADQTFQSMKSKEVRDAASPTKEFTYRGQDLKELSNAGWNVESENSTTDDGHTRVKAVHANIEGRYDVEGGTGQFAAVDHHKQAVTEYHDNNTSLKRNESSSNTSAHEQVVRQTDDGTQFKSTTSSSSTSSKFEQVSSTKQETVPYVTNNEFDVTQQPTCDTSSNIDDSKTNRFSDIRNTESVSRRINYEEAELLSRKVEYPDENTKIIVETRCLPDGTRVTSTRREFRAPIVHNSHTEQHSQSTKTEKSSYKTDRNFYDHNITSNKITSKKNEQEIYDIVDHQKLSDERDFRKHQQNDTYKTEIYVKNVDNQNPKQNNYIDDRDQTNFNLQENTFEKRYKNERIEENSSDMSDFHEIKTVQNVRNVTECRSTDTKNVNHENYEKNIKKQINQQTNESETCKNQSICKRIGEDSHNVTQVQKVVLNNTKNTHKNVEQQTQKKEDVTETKTVHQTDYSNKKISHDWSPSHQAWASTLRSDSPSVTRPSTRASSPGSKTFKSSNSSLRSSISPDKTCKKPTSRGGSPTKYDRHSPSRTLSEKLSDHYSTTTESQRNKSRSPERRYPDAKSPTRDTPSHNKNSHNKFKRVSVSPEKHPKDAQPNSYNVNKPDYDRGLNKNAHGNSFEPDNGIHKDTPDFKIIHDKPPSHSSLFNESCPSVKKQRESSPASPTRTTVSPEKKMPGKTEINTDHDATYVSTNKTYETRTDSMQTTTQKYTSPCKDSTKRGFVNEISEPNVTRDSVPESIVPEGSRFNPNKKQTPDQKTFDVKNNQKSKSPSRSDFRSGYSPERKQTSEHKTSSISSERKLIDVQDIRKSASPNRPDFRPSLSPERKQTPQHKISSASPERKPNKIQHIRKSASPDRPDKKPALNPEREQTHHKISSISPDRKPDEIQHIRKSTSPIRPDFRTSLSPEKKQTNGKISSISPEKTLIVIANNRKSASPTRPDVNIRSSPSPDRKLQPTLNSKDESGQPKSFSPESRSTTLSRFSLSPDRNSEHYLHITTENKNLVKNPTTQQREPSPSKKICPENTPTYMKHTSASNPSSNNLPKRHLSSPDRKSAERRQPSLSPEREFTDDEQYSTAIKTHSQKFISEEERNNIRTQKMSHSPDKIVTSPSQIPRSSPPKRVISPTTIYLDKNNVTHTTRNTETEESIIRHDKNRCGVLPQTDTAKGNFHTKERSPDKFGTYDKKKYTTNEKHETKTTSSTHSDVHDTKILKSQGDDLYTFDKQIKISSIVRKSPERCSPSKSGSKDDKHKHITDFINVEKQTEETNTKNINKSHPRQLVTPSTSPIRKLNIDQQDKAPSTGQSSPTTSVSGFVYYSSPRPGQNDVPDPKTLSTFDKINTAEDINKTPEHLKKKSPQSPSKIPCRSPSPEKRISHNNDNMPRKSSLKKPSVDSKKSSPTETPPSNFCVLPKTEKEDVSENNSHSKYNSELQTEDKIKPKPPLERRETYEERCRKILGMVDDSNMNSNNNKPQTFEANKTSLSISPCVSPDYPKELSFQEENKYIVNKTDLHERIEQEVNTKMTEIRSNDRHSVSRESSPTKLQDIISQPKTVKKDLSSTALDSYKEVKHHPLRSTVSSSETVPNKNRRSPSYPSPSSPIKGVSRASTSPIRQIPNKDCYVTVENNTLSAESKLATKVRTSSPCKMDPDIIDSKEDKFYERPAELSRSLPVNDSETNEDIKKYSESVNTKFTEFSTHFIESEREQEILNKVQKSLRKLSPDRKKPHAQENSAIEKQNDADKGKHDKHFGIENSNQVKRKQIKEVTSIKRTGSFDRDDSFSSKLPARSTSPLKKTVTSGKNTDIDLPVKSRSISPRKPLHSAERPQSPQMPKSPGTKSKESNSITQTTIKPTSPTKEKSVTTKESKKPAVTVKQNYTSKITTVQTNKFQHSTNKSTDQNMKRQTTSTKSATKDDVSKEVSPKFTRTFSDNSIKMNKPSQKIKSKPDVKVTNVVVTKISKQIPNTTKVLKSKLKGPDSRLIDKPKSATTLNTSTEDSDIMVDVQLAKSSRESSPDHICPTPINYSDEDGTPRLPDEVSEPDDNYYRRIHNTIHETETIVDDIIEINEEDELFVKKSEADNNTEEENSLLIHKSRMLTSPNTTQVECRPKNVTYHLKEKERTKKSDISENDLKSDECLLTVSQKVNKFGKVTTDIKDNKSPTRNIVDEYDRNTIYQDEHTKLSVNDKAHFFVETAENIKSNKSKTPRKIERPDLTDVEDSLRSDDCLLSVSDKVNKFVKTAEQFLNETNEFEEKDRKIKAQHDEIMKKIVQESEDEEDITIISRNKFEKEHRKSPERHNKLGSFADDTTSSHAKAKDFASPNLKPTEKPQTLKITTLRSSEAVKKAKELFENISSSTQKVTETKGTKLTDIGVLKNSSKPNTTAVLDYTKISENTDFDNEIDERSKPARQITKTCIPADDVFHNSSKPDSKSNRSQSPTKYRTQSPKPQNTENVTSTTTVRSFAGNKNEHYPHFKSEKQEHVPSYQRPTKTSQLKEETKVIEDTELSTRRGSNKFGVELRRTSTERSTVSSERRRSVEHHQPCIEDIFDLDLLEQMLEKVVGYEQRRRIRSQIRIAKKKIESDINIDTNTHIKLKSTKTKTKSPERYSNVHTIQTVSQEHPSIHKIKKKTTSPNRIQTKEDVKSTINSCTTEPETINTSHRSRSPIKPTTQLTNKVMSPIRQTSPEKKSRKSSPTKTLTSKSKVNRFNEYASAYMKKVGLNETDKVSSVDLKTKKKVNLSDQNVTKHSDEHNISQQTTVTSTSNSYRETVATENSEVTQLNGKRTPSPDMKHIPERKLQSPTERPQQRSPSPKSKRNTPDDSKNETIIKTVYDIEKKNQPKPLQDEKPSWVTNRNLKKISSETRTFSSKKLEQEKQKYRAPSPSKVISKPTDVITSSYGPGPLDADGKPLFGIKALRNGATNYQVKGTVVRQEFHSRNGGEPEGTVSVTAYSTEPKDLEKLLQAQGEKPSRIHGLAAITTTKKFGGDTGTTLKEAHSKEDQSSLEQFTHSDRRVTDTRTHGGTGGKGQVTGKRGDVQDRTEKVVKGDREKKTVRQSSVKSLTEKYIKSTAEAARPERGSYPKAGLILRSGNMKDSVSSDSSTHAGLARTDSEHSLASDDAMETVTTSRQTKDGSYTSTTTRRIHTESRQEHAERSFLDSNTKVTGVQDILTRMKNADIVIEDGDTMEDSEARALLNKFLGATVLMAGMQGYVADSPSGKVIVKQETVRSASGSGKGSIRVQEIDLDQCWDERVLRKLLDECTDYEQRRRLRARLRSLMAEQEACTSAVTEALVAAESTPAEAADSDAREEEAVTTVTSSVRRNSSEKTSTTTTTTTKTSKVIESLPRSAAPKPVSPFAKFRQLEKQNSTNSPKM